MKKRALIMTLVFALLIGVLSGAVFADDESAEETPDNFVILLDCSMSLKTSDPQNLCLQACKSFVDKLPSQNARVSVVAYGYKDGSVYTYSEQYGVTANNKNAELVHVIVPLSDLSTTEATTEYKSIVEKAVLENRDNKETWSPISYGIAAAVDMLEKEKVEDDKACIILVSDGMSMPVGKADNETGYNKELDLSLSDKAPTIAGEHGWTIYSIQLNYGKGIKEADREEAEEYLEEICEKSGAVNVDVIDCEEPIDVHVAFQSIFADYYHIDITPPEKIKLPGSYEFTVPELTSEASIDIFSEIADTNIESVKLVYIADGEETEIAAIRKSYEEDDIRAVVEEGYYSIKLFCPKAGTWKAYINGQGSGKVLVSSTEIKEMGLKMTAEAPSTEKTLKKSDTVSVDAFFYYRSKDLRNLDYYMAHTAKLLVMKGSNIIDEYEMESLKSGFHYDLSLADLAGGTYTLKVSLEDDMFRDGIKYSNTSDFKIENMELTVASTQEMALFQYVNDTVEINLSNIFNNPDNDPITCEIRCVEDRSVKFEGTVDNDGYLVFNTGRIPGKYTLELDASDPDMKTPATYKSVILNVTNRAPQQTEKLGDRTLLVNTYSFDKTDLTDFGFSLDEYFTDPDGVPLEFTVTADSGCIELQRDGNYIQILPNSIGTAVVTVAANDSVETIESSFEVKVENGKAHYWKQYGVFYAIGLAIIVVIAVVIIIILKNKRVKGKWDITLSENSVPYDIQGIDIGAYTKSGHSRKFKLGSLVAGDLSTYLEGNPMAGPFAMTLPNYFAVPGADKVELEGVYGKTGATICNGLKGSDDVRVFVNGVELVNGSKKVTHPGETIEVTIKDPNTSNEFRFSMHLS